MDASKKIEYQKMLLTLVPASGENVGNVTLREQLRERIEAQGDQLADEDYWLLRDSLIDGGLLEQGRGRGGSVHRVRAVVSGSTAAAEGVQAVGPGGAAAPTIVPPVWRPEEVAEKTEISLYEPFHNASETDTRRTAGSSGSFLN